MDEIANYSESVFEDIKHVNEYSQEFWCARELQIALEYKDCMEVLVQKRFMHVKN